MQSAKGRYANGLLLIRPILYPSNMKTSIFTLGILATMCLGCSEKRSNVAVVSISHGNLLEGEHTIKTPKTNGSAMFAGENEIKFLSGEESIITVQNNSDTSLLIKSNYTIPDSIYQQAQNMYYATLTPGIPKKEIDSLIAADQKENKGIPHKIIYRFGYDVKTKRTFILCAFTCPGKKEMRNGSETYTIYTKRRPMFLLTIDSNEVMQKLSYFSTQQVIDNNGTIAAVLGAFINADTLITAEITKRGDAERPLPLYATYIDQNGKYIKGTSPTLKYESKNNLALNEETQMYAPSFYKQPNGEVLMSDFRNVYNITTSSKIYSLPKDYCPTSAIIGMSTHNNYLILAQGEIKAESRIDSPLFITVADMKTGTAMRVFNTHKRSNVYTCILQDNRMFILYKEGEILKYETFQIH